MAKAKDNRAEVLADAMEDIGAYAEASALRTVSPTPGLGTHVLILTPCHYWRGVVRQATASGVLLHPAWLVYQTGDDVTGAVQHGTMQGEHAMPGRVWVDRPWIACAEITE